MGVGVGLVKGVNSPWQDRVLIYIFLARGKILLYRCSLLNMTVSYKPPMSLYSLDLLPRLSLVLPDAPKSIYILPRRLLALISTYYHGNIYLL
jgi:hypothetical protein